MAERPKSRTVQLSDLLDRIERIEERLRSREKGPAEKRDKGTTRTDEDEGLRFCSMPKVKPYEPPPGVSPERARLILLSRKKWVNGTKLRYYFFDNGAFAGGNDQKEIVREGFDVWRSIGIGIQFEEVRDISEAEIRIGFLRGDGAWSYLGRDVVDIPGQTERTMNFGWDLNQDPRREDVAVHEIGHTLGFPHEHQNPISGIEWDEQAVYDYFGGPPNNWDRDATFHNVLRKLSRGEVEGSEWDPNSIMHYAFSSGLIRRPEQYASGLEPAGGLSERDIDQAILFYPRLDPSSDTELVVGRSEPLALAPAEQRNFVLRVTATRDYVIQTLGRSDTVVVLFEDQNGDLKFVAGDDDSGTDLNSRINVRLYQGRRYVLRIRLYSSFAVGTTVVIMT